MWTNTFKAVLKRRRGVWLQLCTKDTIDDWGTQRLLTRERCVATLIRIATSLGPLRRSAPRRLRLNSLSHFICDTPFSAGSANEIMNQTHTVILELVNRPCSQVPFTDTVRCLIVPFKCRLPRSANRFHFPRDPMDGVRVEKPGNVRPFAFTKAERTVTELIKQRNSRCAAAAKGPPALSISC
jgi:hypothetical protein